SGRRRSLLRVRDSSGQPSILVHDGGAEAQSVLYGHLRTRAATADKDIGEDVSIAVCATELPEAVFVTMDKRAAYVALSELGRGRVAAPFELWDELERSGLLTLETYKNLCEKTAKRDHGLAAVPRRHQR